MQICRLENRKGERGFTLVELAIVMIIIGLLIGGILKGQELIANAQVTATVSQMKGIDAATSTFRDAYDAFPGDITNPGARLPGCGAAPCNVGGTGEGRVNGAVGGVQTAVGGAASEGNTFWTHLSFANVLSGIAIPGDLSWGGGFPASEINGGYSVGWFGGGAPPNGAVGASNLRGGHWIAVQAVPTTAIGGAVGVNPLTPTQAARIDRKMDDGDPDTGSVQPGGNAACVAAGGVGSIYNETNTSTDCGVYVRIQG